MRTPGVAMTAPWSANGAIGLWRHSELCETAKALDAVKPDTEPQVTNRNET
jgi:hypothetical protein